MTGHESSPPTERGAPGEPDGGRELSHLYALAVNLQAAGHFEAAIETYRRCRALNPNLPEIHNNLGTALDRMGRLQEAVDCFERALALDPAYVRPLVNLGRVLRLQNKVSESIASLERALVLSPDNPAALTNLGFALADVGRSREAMEALSRAVAREPALAAAHHGLGRVLLDLGDVPAACESLRNAVRLNPALFDAYPLFAASLIVLRRFPDALEVAERLLERRPEDADALAVRLNCASRMCDWERVESTLLRIRRLPGGTANVQPFLLMSACNDPAEHLAAARERAARVVRGRTALPHPPQREHTRIRVAYVSRDFFTHATAFLMAELLELHDRSRFEVFGVSFGPDDGSPLRQRVLGAFDAWLEGTRKSDLEIATWMREREIDIAVDLKGYTAFARPGIFACRPAPVQVSYLGYPGTMAAPFMDYLIADRWVIPESEQGCYSENIVYLPDCYQVNDRRRRISATAPSRAEAGLPEEGLVFCCFNVSWKITPPVFHVWMRLLAAVPGSVLWLLEDNPWAVRNLRREAAAREVAPERLIFCAQADNETHLARQRLADLFLDTFPCNAHTTASDALWAGLPLLTISGRTFASRVAGSLLRATGLPELIASSLEDYERLALELARNPERLATLRMRLTRDREALPLFDTPTFCRHLEAAYRHIWLLQQEGKPRETFAVEGLEGEAARWQM